MSDQITPPAAPAPEVQDDEAVESNQRKVSPAKGRLVRHENGALLEPRTVVEWSAYWQRRSDDGDIIIHQPKQTAEKKD